MSGHAACRPRLPFANGSPEGRAHRAAQMRALRAADPERYRAASRRYAAQLRAKVLRNERARRYRHKIDRVEYDRMMAMQNGLCDICGGTEKHTLPDGRVRPLSVDHCHTTGKIRGLLCGRCNFAIGMLRDDPALAANAAEYLNKHKGLP